VIVTGFGNGCRLRDFAFVLRFWLVMWNRVHPKILELCAKVTAKRPRTVIDHLINHGSITTEDLQVTYGYDHPPRAVADVKDQGIPIERFSVISARTGRKIAAYRFGNPDRIIRGRIGGRKAFSKAFKATLTERYGARDAFTGEECILAFCKLTIESPIVWLMRRSLMNASPRNTCFLTHPANAPSRGRVNTATIGGKPKTRTLAGRASGLSRNRTRTLPERMFGASTLNGRVMKSPFTRTCAGGRMVKVPRYRRISSGFFAKLSGSDFRQPQREIQTLDRFFPATGQCRLRRNSRVQHDLREAKAFW